MRMGGGAKPFGIDAERAASLVRHVIAAGADWRGFHIFAGSQTLDADAIIDAQRATLGLAARLAEEADRSEEHTSELQSLMRSSYAVFCLKKKKKYNTLYTATEIAPDNRHQPHIEHN